MDLTESYNPVVCLVTMLLIACLFGYTELKPHSSVLNNITQNADEDKYLQLRIPDIRGPKNFTVQDDILLTLSDFEDWKPLTGPVKDQPLTTTDTKLRERKNIVDFSLVPEKKWDSIIYYKMNHTTIPNKNHRSIIKRALDMWQAKTCLSFDQLDDGIHMENQHLLMYGIGTGCASFIGKQDQSEVFPQVVHLGNTCFSLNTAAGHEPDCATIDRPVCVYCTTQIGKVLHEIGHVLGLYHEHQRPDRDAHISVVWKNVQPGMVHNFYAKKRTVVATSTDLPYGYDSVMQYGPLIFSTDKKHRKYTIVPHDPNLLPNMGQRSHLSFNDVRAVNVAYCKGVCPDIPPCFHHGYPDPTNCSRCLCPEEWRGVYCTEVPRGAQGCLPTSKSRYHKAAQLNTVFSLYSPRYSKGTFNEGDNCFWLLKAPEEMVFKFWFGNLTRIRPVFGLYKTPGDGGCLFWVEIKSPVDKPGRRFCGYYKESPDFVHFSGTNEAYVIFQSFEGVKYPALSPNSIAKRGFRLQYRVVAQSKTEPSETEKE